MSRSFGLLHSVALHDLPVSVDADVPRATRLALSVQHGRIGHVVVLKYTFFKFTLGVEVFLQNQNTPEILINSDGPTGLKSLDLRSKI